MMISVEGYCPETAHRENIFILIFGKAYMWDIPLQITKTQIHTHTKKKKKKQLLDMISVSFIYPDTVCFYLTMNDPCASGYIWGQLWSTRCITNTKFVSISSCGLLERDSTPLEWCNSTSLSLPSLSDSLLFSCNLLRRLFKKIPKKAFSFLFSSHAL